MAFRRWHIFVTFVMAAFAFGAGAQPFQSFDKSNLAIDTAKGPQTFTVDLAVTPQQEMQGLMYRRSMPADAGMLFDFHDVAVRVFWMKNTFIPLDMLFIATDGRIVDIHERAVPLSEANIVSREPARAVLELNGGTVGRLGITIGGMVHNPIFGNGG
jgi:uncharacterized protein